MNKSVEQTQDLIADTDSFFKKLSRFSIAATFFIICLIFFTLIKLPEAKLKNLIISTVQSSLSPMGIQFYAETGKLQIGLGISYQFKRVSLLLSNYPEAIEFDEIHISPSFSSLLLGNLSIQAKLKQLPSPLQKGKSGILELDLKTPLLSLGQTIDLQTSFTQIDLNQLHAIPLISQGLQGSGLLSGELNMSGNLNTLQELQGKGSFRPSQLTIHAQNFSGFNIPKLSISEGNIQFKLSGGKALLETVKVGKSGDDIQAQLSGEIQLGKTLMDSQSNMMLRFSLSQTIHKAFALLDSLLAAGKQADGGYTFSLRGPFLSPEMAPLTGPR